MMIGAVNSGRGVVQTSIEADPVVETNGGSDTIQGMQTGYQKIIGDLKHQLEMKKLEIEDLKRTFETELARSETETILQSLPKKQREFIAVSGIRTVASPASTTDWKGGTLQGTPGAWPKVESKY